jgi:murein DD-endopeptidase MepM/ murein hydrolase activator NlpD
MGRRGRAASLYTLRLSLSGLVALASLLVGPVAPVSAEVPAKASSSIRTSQNQEGSQTAPASARPRTGMRSKATTAPGRTHATLPAGLLSRARPPRGTVAEPGQPLQMPPPPLTAPAGDPPLIWPVIGTLNSPFGPRRARFHAGIDIGARHAAPVVAARAGHVHYARSTRGPLGKTVVLEHGDGLRTVYAHLSRIVAKEGAIVHQGDRIGAVGRTGRATGPHLHFEVHRHGKPVSPQAFLPGPPTELVRAPGAALESRSEAHLLPSPPAPGTQPASHSASPAEPTS